MTKKIDENRALAGLREAFGSKLGIKISTGPATPRKPAGSAIGWAMLAGRMGETGAIAVDGRDAVEVAVGHWISKGRLPIELVVYDEQTAVSPGSAWRASEHARAGMSVAEHRAMALKLKARVEALGGSVSLIEIH